jgi:hypothetical protein
MRREERDYSHRSLFDKLGIKPDHRIYARRVGEEFLDGVKAVVQERLASTLRGGFDLIFLQINSPRDLEDVTTLAAHHTATRFVVPRNRR